MVIVPWGVAISSVGEGSLSNACATRRELFVNNVVPPLPYDSLSRNKLLVHEHEQHHPSYGLKLVTVPSIMLGLRCITLSEIQHKWSGDVQRSC